MNNPAVSVVVPTYNAGGELNSAIQSVLDQTYEHIDEIIVVDDCSEKPAIEILDQENELITVVRHDENRNGAAARNTGIRRASGDLIAFLDDDDIWKLTKLEKQIQKLEANGDEFKACYTGAEASYTDRTEKLIPTSEGDITEEIFLMDIAGSYGSTLLLDSGIANRVDGFDTDFDRHQDLEFLIRVLEHTKICCVSEPLIERDMTEYLQETKFLIENKTMFLQKFSDKIERTGAVTSKKIYSKHYIEIAKTAMRNKDYKIGFNYYLRALSKYPFYSPKELAKPPYYFSRQLTIGFNDE